jgi:hypothetical protein
MITILHVVMVPFTFVFAASLEARHATGVTPHDAGLAVIQAP